MYRTSTYSQRNEAQNFRYSCHVRWLRIPKSQLGLSWAQRNCLSLVGILPFLMCSIKAEMEELYGRVVRGTEREWHFVFRERIVWYQEIQHQFVRCQVFQYQVASVIPRSESCHSFTISLAVEWLCYPIDHKKRRFFSPFVGVKKRRHSFVRKIGPVR